MIIGNKKELKISGLLPIECPN